MIKSMTGYGKGVAALKNGKLIVEIRSVNGKNADISIKSPLLPREREMEVRKELSDTLRRGTVDMFITWEPDSTEAAREINIPLAGEYMSQLKALQESLGVNADGNTLIGALLKLPDVVNSSRQDVVNEDNWPLVHRAIKDAIDAIDRYRAVEGEALYRDVTSRVSLILSIYDEIERREPERIAAIRERIVKAAEEMSVHLDRERFEQEMIFYLEKLDINEEKVRLRQHCKYFMDTIDSEECPGKKLGFILQEMGREINTTGSKASDVTIQKCVVRMKDELEKIREQSMNIL